MLLIFAIFFAVLYRKDYDIKCILFELSTKNYLDSAHYDNHLLIKALKLSLYWSLIGIRLLFI
jgi:hypothetical protein